MLFELLSPPLISDIWCYDYDQDFAFFKLALLS